MISMLFIRSKMMFVLTIQGKDFELIEECSTEGGGAKLWNLP